MAASTRYLEWHGQQWRVRVKVPAKIRHLVGKGKLVYPLHTADLKVANQRKWPHVAQLKARIEAYLKAAGHADEYERQALILRLSRGDDDTAYEIDTIAEQIERRHGTAKARAFAGLATGKITPLDHLAETFVSHQGYRQKSGEDFRRALGWLREWLRANDHPLAIEQVSRTAVSKFITESLVVGRSVSKAQAYLGFLRQYWKWLIEKGHLQTEDNPWVGQSLPLRPRGRRKAEHDGGKRPFTDDEVSRLLGGDGGTLINDLMRVAALSGMRLEEICQLLVSDCADSTFNVWAGKTSNARRGVPIHSGLAEIIARRTEGKSGDAFLFDELPPTPPSRETRSDPAAKRFTRYRRSVGVDERPNDKAKSNVDFHSFRRWFVRKVRDARIGGATGYDEWTLAWVIGHSDNDRIRSLDLSQHGYAGQDPVKAKRALVESVILPT